jgi:hypothetical protein
MAGMISRTKPSRADLLDAAWEVAAYYRAHDAYGSEARARKALQRRRQGFTARQYHKAFQKGVALYDATVELVARDVASLWRQFDLAAESYPDFRSQLPEIRRWCPGFRVSTYFAALNWAFSGTI